MTKRTMFCSNSGRTQTEWAGLNWRRSRSIVYAQRVCACVGCSLEVASHTVQARVCNVAEGGHERPVANCWRGEAEAPSGVAIPKPRRVQPVCVHRVRKEGSHFNIRKCMNLDVGRERESWVEVLGRGIEVQTGIGSQNDEHGRCKQSPGAKCEHELATRRGGKVHAQWQEFRVKSTRGLWQRMRRGRGWGKDRTVSPTEHA